MYKYDLLNNHYVVDIDGCKYIIDTGNPNSFSINNNKKVITIDRINYPLSNKPECVDVQPTFALIGCEVDGFIGLDIIRYTGLTIYKNNQLDFHTQEVEGDIIPMSVYNSIFVSGSCNGKTGNIIIDTGAKYGYGIPELFNGQESLGLVHDYNPILKDLYGSYYKLEFKIGNTYGCIDICDNRKVYDYVLGPSHTIAVINITDLFHEVCVFDFRRKRLILR